MKGLQISKLSLIYALNKKNTIKTFYLRLHRKRFPFSSNILKKEVGTVLKDKGMKS